MRLWTVLTEENPWLVASATKSCRTTRTTHGHKLNTRIDWPTYLSAEVIPGSNSAWRSGRLADCRGNR
jgi:hypothetical protein